MKKYNFSLIELVLVAGCAAIIAALTIAAAGSMAANPKAVACANIMRGLEEKLTAWENDNDGHLIAAHNQGRLWARQLVDAGYFDKNGFYGKSVRIYPKGFDCPAETRQRSNGKVNISKPSVNITTAYDYALNGYVHRPIRAAGVKNSKRANIINPAKLMRMTEATIYCISNTPSHATARHGKGAANVLFADGRVEFVDMVPYKGTKKYSSIFWFNTK